MSRLVSELQPIARKVARTALNTPDLALHLESRVLGWVLAWPHETQLSVRAYIARCAANEARRVLALKAHERADYYVRYQRIAPRIVRPLHDVPAGTTDVCLTDDGE